MPFSSVAFSGNHHRTGVGLPRHSGNRVKQPGQVTQPLVLACLESFWAAHLYLGGGQGYSPLSIFRIHVTTVLG
jgi:hypothetical protein